MERHVNTADAMPMSAIPARPRLTTQALFWLRKTHGWFGLWGAVLGLLFGTAGIWLNHRAVLKIPVAQERNVSQITLPDRVATTPDALAQWLQAELKRERGPNTMRIEPARKVAWALPDGTRPMQPEHWIMTFGGPDVVVQADYWQGNRTVNVVTTRNGMAATLSNLHKGVGMPVPWILLVDTLAGSMIFLSLSGVAIWLLSHRRRASAGLAILGTCLVVTSGLIVWRLGG
jgi:uncharacterized protein